MKTFIVSALTLLIIVGGLLFQFGRNEQGKPTLGPSVAAAACQGDAVKSCLPDVIYETIDEEILDRESLLGKLVIVNFWATWCGPCKKELPDLNRFYAEHKNEVAILGVQRDYQAPSLTREFLETTPVEFPVIKDTVELESAFNEPSRIPASFVYDANGILLEERTGILSYQDLEELLRRSRKSL